MNNVIIKAVSTKDSFVNETDNAQLISYLNFLNISSKSYGQFLILIAFLLSAFSWVCLKTVLRQRISVLHTMQKQSDDLKQKNTQLYTEYEMHFTPNNIQKFASIQGLMAPQLENIIPITTWNYKHQGEH